MRRRKKNPGGRPPRYATVSDVRIAVRCHKSEHERWSRAAGDMPLSEWLRFLANAAAPE